MRGAGLVLRVHGIGEVDDLVGGQPVEQLVVSRDEGGLPGLIRPGRQAFRALVFEAQAMQQRHATRMAVNHAPSRRDIGRHLAAVAHQPFAKPRRELRHLFAAQVAASPLPIKHCHLVQAARLIALEPRPYRVVIKVERSATLAQFQPSSSSKIAFARRATPWISLGCRITACKAVRSLALRNPPRSMAKEESIQERIATTFSGFQGDRVYFRPPTTYVGPDRRQRREPEERRGKRRESDAPVDTAAE